MSLPWFLCSVLLILVFVLAAKIVSLKMSMNEICKELAEYFSEETNTLLKTSSNDRHIRHLTAKLNVQLRLLRQQRQNYLVGNRDLKEAVANISHDLRTPLTAILGYLELANREEKTEAVARYLSVISNRAELLKELTEEFFRYSVILEPEKQGIKEEIVLNELLEESLAAAYTELSEHQIFPDICLPETKVICLLNRSNVLRIFANLISNAIKYSDGDLSIVLTEKGQVTFTNTAAKLDEVQAGKLLDRFYTVETAKKSTGLGLTITRTLVEQMNGSISLDYQNNQLSIGITLPRN
ncbi:sensor histidine kinase [Candidatus Enterococcus ferrettii]|uniref:histidine kinase n=1 Tax=Candidatus Enterococcus ferrettii TaxID=2815324 RepID=A0ABV0ELG2_9ENTE|nr:HAMP domain-containing sensor histidine kinase [Enterococcus sp. 665A]MBO1340037.1 HAMP domain-containing histidine kinase [Enterococcus sp. 665A]